MDVLSELRQLVYKLRRDDVRSVQALVRKVIGDQVAATMVTRLLYWLPKSHSGWVYKSWRDWEAECGITRAQIKRVHGSGLLETVGIERKIMKAAGAPTVHYRLDVEAFFERIASCLNISQERIQVLLAEDANRSTEPSETDQFIGPESPNQKGENEPIHWAETDQSITIKSQQSRTTGIDKQAQQQAAADQTVFLSLQEVGFSPAAAQILLDKYGHERVQAVLDRASIARPNNPAGFVRRALEQGWTLTEKPRQELYQDPKRYISGEWGAFIRH
jgi:hypothetical protein